MTTIVHPFHPYERLREQEQTWACLDVAARAGYRVVHWPTQAPHDYAAGLRAMWQTDSLMVVEQDTVVPLERLHEMSSCVAGLCAFPTRKHGRWTHGHWTGEGLEPGRDGDVWASVADPGALLIGRPVQDIIRPDASKTYGGVLRDLLVQAAAHGIRTHLHWPEAAHNHEY